MSDEKDDTTKEEIEQIPTDYMDEEKVIQERIKKYVAKFSHKNPNGNLGNNNENIVKTQEQIEEERVC